MQVRSLGQGGPLKEGMAIHSSILAWKNFMDREAWQCADHRITKSRTTLNRLSKHGNIVCNIKTKQIKKKYQKIKRGFPGGTVVKNLPAKAGDVGSIPDPGKSHMLWSN